MITASGNPKSVLASVKEVEILSLNDVETEHEERIYTKKSENWIVYLEEGSYRDR